MYLFSKISLHIAGIIIFLHTITPHSHNNVSKESQVQSICFLHTDTLVLEFILGLVSNNLGEHHLEDFVIEETIFNKIELTNNYQLIPFIDISVLSLKPLPILLNFYYNSTGIESKSITSINSNNFRGPPYF